MTQKIIRTYSELIKFQSFTDRFNYLRLDGTVGESTFGFDRYLNQIFYRSSKWKSIRDHVIIRDSGCDLGVEGFEIYSRVLIHHMNPITIDDIMDKSDFLLDPEFLICTTHNTHNAIHYGNESLLMVMPVERTKNDTCPWKK